MITKRQLLNALEMYIDDEVENEDNIYASEMQKIKRQFDRIWEDLKEEAEEEIEEE